MERLMKKVTVRQIDMVVVITILLAISTPSLAASSLPRIRILGTGGTIAGVQPTGLGRGFQSGVLSAKDLIATVPQLQGIADITTEQVCNIGSQTMNNEIWLKLAKRLNQVLQDTSVDGVVITHGTNTMEETAYFLNLIVKSDKPIVMVGAMRPASSLSADGPMNIYNAVALAGNSKARGRGVLVVLNDEIHYAREVEKTNTARMDAFESPNRGKAGVIAAGEVLLFAPPDRKHGLSSEFSIDDMTELPRVEIVYSYANFGRDTIDFLVHKKVKGIILAGVGDGNTTDEALAGLRDAVTAGIVVVRSTRVPGGVTSRNIEVNDDEMGTIASGELTAPKARILLMLGLTKTGDVKQLQHYFYEY
jgi:L-asparaginase